MVLARRSTLGHCIEIHTNLPLFRRFDVAVARAAQGWDGSDPLRLGLPEEFVAELSRYMGGGS